MNAIVVVDQNWAIGRDNDLLFSLPTDMKRFRSLTLGGTVILGRRTLDSFPGGRPLPKRRNIVITHCPDFSREGAETVSSLAAMREATAGTPPDQLWVIGGGSIYAALLSQCARAYVTLAYIDHNKGKILPAQILISIWKANIRAISPLSNQ